MIMNLETKLQMVDDQYKVKWEKENLKPSQIVEEKLLKFKKEYDLRMKAEMNAEITRIREFEISNIKIEEQEKNRLNMEAYRDDMEKNYLDKLAKLRDRYIF